MIKITKLVKHHWPVIEIGPLENCNLAKSSSITNYSTDSPVKANIAKYNDSMEIKLQKNNIVLKVREKPFSHSNTKNLNAWRKNVALFTEEACFLLTEIAESPRMNEVVVNIWCLFRS